MKMIGMIVPTADNTFFSNLAHYTEKAFSENGYQTLICDSGNDAKKEKEYLKTLEGICEGIIDVSGLSEAPENINVPIVFADRKPASSNPIAWVANDDEAAMKEATLFLIEKGCKNIVLMPGYIAEKQENPRVKGYKAALEENGLAFDESYVITRKGTGSSESETEQLVMNMMREGKKIDGIITSSDRAAFGAVKALGKGGYYVPEDVRLISFDNSPYSTMASPSITSIDRNPELLAKKACEVLLKKINGEETDNENIIPVSLVKRDSTR